MKEKEIDCVVRGKVQDVGYRVFVKKHADIFDLVGFVQNEEDGTVNVVGQGEVEKLEKFIEEIKKGPYFSRIDEVVVEWSDILQDGLTEFEIL